MLEYEKRLHLDKQWEKMQSSNVIKNIIFLVWSILCFIFLFIGLRWLMADIPDVHPWSNSSLWRSIFGISFLQVDTLFFLFGIIIYMYASIRFIGINKENHSVRTKSDMPESLLITGFYAKVRHPMYGVFVIWFAAVFLSLRSVIGIFLAVLFAMTQYANAYREEKKTLVPLFGDEYRQYSDKVRHLLLNKWEVIMLLSFVVFGLIGLI